MSEMPSADVGARQATDRVFDSMPDAEQVAEYAEMKAYTDAELITLFNDANGDGQPYYTVWCVDEHRLVLGGSEDDESHAEVPR